jgi:PKD repeat protein
MKSGKFSRAFKIAAATLLLPCVAFAAQPRGTSETNREGPIRGVQVGAPVTPHSINVDLRKLPRAKQWVPGMPIKEAHRRVYRPIGAKLPHTPANRPTEKDRLPELQEMWDQSSAGRAMRGKVAARKRVSINNPNTGVSPGDPVVEVGANHVIYAVNGTSTTFNVYDKSGTLVAGPTSFGSLAPAGNSCTSDRGDPLVYYDRQAGRWFMLTMDDAGMCTFVSKTSNPVTGGWWFYSYSTPTLPDYPHCGVWNDAYVCASNEGNAQVTLYAFDRANMLNGATARPAQRFVTVNKLPGYGFQILTPSTFYGTAAAPTGRKQLIARHRDDEAHDGASANATQDFIELFELNLDWNTPANSNIATLPRVAITEFNSWFTNYSTFATVPQPGSTSKLDPIREVLLNQLTYRNFGTHESVVGTLATNQNSARTGTVVDSGVRWFELRRVGAGNWTLHQEGTFSPGDTNTHHLMGTAAMDKFGNIGLGYNVTKTTTPTKFATLGYTGRAAGDALGVMSLGENEVAIGAAAETSGRWGDYYQMTVDPVDDCTFWFVGMYRPTGSWQTRIQDFKFPACGGAATFAVSGSVTTSGGAGISGVNVSASGGGSATTDANGAYTLNLANGTYTLTPSRSGYTFSPTTRSVTVSGAAVGGQNFTGTPPANVPPVANFTFTTSGLTANFTDTSTDSDGTIASRSWNFGDSTTSTATNPSKTYAAAGTYTVTLTVTDNGGATHSKSSSVTVTAPTGNVLTNGVPVTGLSGATGAELRYTLAVPSGASNLRFVTSGGTGDADLYVRFNAAPTTATYDCRSIGGTNAETCNIATAQVGTYHVLVRGYSAFSGLSLTGSYTTGGGGGTQTYSSSAVFNISDNTTINSPITVSGRTGNASATSSVSVNITHTYQGDLKVDLVAPDGTLYNIHNRTGGSADNVIKTVTLNLSSELLNGTWNMRVNDNAAGDVGQLNSWSVTF